MDWIRNRRARGATPPGPAVSGQATGTTPSWIVQARTPAAPPRRGLTQPPPAAPATSWSGQLFYVNDNLVVTLVSRIVASAELCRVLQTLPDDMEPLKSCLPDRRVPRDLNPALAAVCLIRATQQRGVLPVLDMSVQIGQPASTGGDVIGLERDMDDLLLRVYDPDTGVRAGMRLLGGARQGWQPADLRGRRVLGVGITRRARYRQLDAAGIAFIARTSAS